MVARILDEEQKQNLIKEERERRRIARLRQVRQQSAVHAKVIREIVSQKKSEIIEDVRAELHQEVSAKIEDIIVRTPRKSSGSKVAKRKSMSENAKKKIARRRPLTSQDLKLANQRNVEALRKLKESKNQEKRQKLEKIERRKEAEKVANNISKQK